MILKKYKKCLLMGLLSQLHGWKLPIGGAPPNGQPGVGEVDKSQHRSHYRDLDSRVLKSQKENAFENQNKRHRRETVSNNHKMMLQFDDYDSIAEL